MKRGKFRVTLWFSRESLGDGMLKIRDRTGFHIGGSFQQRVNPVGPTEGMRGLISTRAIFSERASGVENTLSGKIVFLRANSAQHFGPGARLKATYLRPQSEGQQMFKERPRAAVHTTGSKSGTETCHRHTHEGEESPQNVAELPAYNIAGGLGTNR